MVLSRKIAFAAILALTGCGGGSASVEGDIGGYSFDLQTIFGWIDEKELTEMDGKRVYVTRDEPTLHLVLSGASYDPSRDLRFASVTELADLAADAVTRGSIAMRVRRYGAVTSGAVIAIPSNDPEGAPQLSLDFNFGLKELEKNAEFPAELPRFGSKGTARLTLSELGKAAGESVKGTLEIGIEADDREPSTVRTGRLTVEFDAALISERIAECNASQSRTDPECEPEYPRG
jgi:hypothetical protein